MVDSDDSDNDNGGRSRRRRPIRVPRRGQQQAPSALVGNNADIPDFASSSSISRAAAAAAAAVADQQQLQQQLQQPQVAVAAARREPFDADDDYDDLSNDNPAAAAAAAPGGDDNDNTNPQLEQLLQQLRQVCTARSSGNVPTVSAIDVEMARNVLEACAGNAQLAGQLYWDNHFASIQQEQQQQQQQEQAAAEAAAAVAVAAAASANRASSNSAEEEERQVRRRLERDFESLLPQQPQPREELLQQMQAANNLQREQLQEEVDELRSEQQRLMNRMQARRRRGNREPGRQGRRPIAPMHPYRNYEEEEEDDDDVVFAEFPRNNDNNDDANLQPAAPAVPQQRVNPVPRRDDNPPAAALQDDNQALVLAAQLLGHGADDANDEPSANVSDDEAGFVRMVRERSNQLRLHGPSYARAREIISAQLSADDDNVAASGGTKRKWRPSRKKINVSGSVGRGGGGDYAGDDNSDSSSDSSHNSRTDVDDGYLSENDWLLALSSTDPTTSSGNGANPAVPVSDHEEVRDPMDILWGNHLTPAEGSVVLKKKVLKDENEDGHAEMPGAKTKHKVKKEEGAVSDDEDNKDVDNNDDNTIPGGNPNNQPEIDHGIPSTWWYASFSPHATTAMGLALKDPKPEEISDNSWRIHQLQHPELAASDNPRRNSTTPPMPYHCRAITALLSIVTALIYSGASVQADHVTTSSSRVPFLELSEEERRQQFDSRLVDALSCLVFIAAQSSMTRKKKAVDKLLAKKDRRVKRRRKKMEDAGEEFVEEPDVLKLNLKRKIKLCPVTWWREHPTSHEPMPPAEQWQKGHDDDQPVGPWIQLTTSYSNISDIRDFVLSNIRSFTAPGGVALLLETIVRIHGRGVVTRMLNQSKESTQEAETRKDDKCYYSAATNPFLVRCTCVERQKKKHLDPSLTPAARRKLMTLTDATPLGHDCIGVELISLLLTGKVHSTFSGWSTGPLGFGMLSSKCGEIGRELSRPEMPVWVLKGETCYSVLALDHTNHGEHLNKKAPLKAMVTEEANQAKKVGKKPLSPGKPKGAPEMQIAMCSSSSRSRDLTEARAFASGDAPNFVANLIHWNTWFNIRNLSGLRLITDRPKWKPPTPSKILLNYSKVPQDRHAESMACERKTIKERLLESRKKPLTNVVSCDEESEDAKATSTSPILTETALAQIQHHPDDANFYPKQYRRWRFDVGEKESPDQSLNLKPRGKHWTPYFSLPREDQMLVEAKYGPKINCILWTRWPRATIDKFTPEEKFETFPIV